MDAAIRGAVICAFLLVVFRIAGRRTLAEMTSFDFVLLLIIGRRRSRPCWATFSVTNALIVIATLVGADIGLSILKEKFPRFAKVADGTDGHRRRWRNAARRHASGADRRVRHFAISTQILRARTP